MICGAAPEHYGRSDRWRAELAGQRRFDHQSSPNSPATGSQPNSPNSNWESATPWVRVWRKKNVVFRWPEQPGGCVVVAIPVTHGRRVRQPCMIIAATDRLPASGSQVMLAVRAQPYVVQPPQIALIGAVAGWVGFRFLGVWGCGGRSRCCGQRCLRSLLVERCRGTAVRPDWYDLIRGKP